MMNSDSGTAGYYTALLASMRPNQQGASQRGGSAHAWLQAKVPTGSFSPTRQPGVLAEALDRYGQRLRGAGAIEG